MAASHDSGINVELILYRYRGTLLGNIRRNSDRMEFSADKIIVSGNKRAALWEITRWNFMKYRTEHKRLGVYYLTENSNQYIFHLEYFLGIQLKLSLITCYGFNKNFNISHISHCRKLLNIYNFHWLRFSKCQVKQFTYRHPIIPNSPTLTSDQNLKPLYKTCIQGQYFKNDSSNINFAKHNPDQECWLLEEIYQNDVNVSCAPAQVRISGLGVRSTS